MSRPCERSGEKEAAKVTRIPVTMPESQEGEKRRKSTTGIAKTGRGRLAFKPRKLEGKGKSRKAHGKRHRRAD